jgi:integrase
MRSVAQRWPDAAVCLIVLAQTGCRRDEVRLIERGWIDWETGEVAWPDSKTGAGSLHLSPAAVRLLAEARDRHADGRPWLFRSADGTGPLARSTLYRAWAAALGVAVELGADARRLDGLRPHDLRHTFASLGLSSGLSLDDVRRLLRHRSRRSTERYARLLPSRERELALASETFLRLA